MNALLLSLTLTAPAHPPGFPPRPPVVVVPARPPVIVVPPRLPVVVVPAPRPPIVVVPVAPPVSLYPPPVVVPAPVVPSAITLGEFSRYFTPAPGKHDVWVVHPVTQQPVQVCFTLPHGRLKDFEVDRRSIRFEFAGGREVEIEFRNNGTVRVEYDD